MKKPLALVMVALVALSACGKSPDSASPPSGEKLNAESDLGPPASQTPGARADAEDPKTGTVYGRPDSPKDLKPGTDGNTNPPTP